MAIRAQALAALVLVHLQAALLLEIPHDFCGSGHWSSIDPMGGITRASVLEVKLFPIAEKDAPALELIRTADPSDLNPVAPAQNKDPDKLIQKAELQDDDGVGVCLVQEKVGGNDQKEEMAADVDARQEGRVLKSRQTVVQLVPNPFQKREQGGPGQHLSEEGEDFRLPVPHEEADEFAAEDPNQNEERPVQEEAQPYGRGERGPKGCRFLFFS